jgi:hypothetical protein
VNGNLTINPNVPAHGNYSGDVVLQVNYTNGTNVQVVLPLAESV